MATKYKKSEGYIKNVYEKYFGFHPPYQFLIDDSMCLASLQHKFDLKERLTLVTGGAIRPMVSSCVMDALRRTAKQHPDDPIRTGAPFVGRRMELRRCNHSPSLPIADCFKQLLGEQNTFHYGVAANCEEIKGLARSKLGIPLIYLERTFPLLEPPTKATIEATTKMERGKLHLGPLEAAMIKKQLGEEEKIDLGPKHKRKRVRGPNPLSVKKSKKHSNQPPLVGWNSNDDAKDTSKAKRKRKSKNKITLARESIGS